eukprot:668342-Amphidinium_carterae.1
MTLNVSCGWNSQNSTPNESNTNFSKPQSGQSMRGESDKVRDDRFEENSLTHIVKGANSENLGPPHSTTPSQ